MLNKLSELGKFTMWLDQQHCDTKYDWGDGENCLMAKYLKATKQEENGMPDWYMSVTLPKPWTTGAALDRAKRLSR